MILPWTMNRTPYSLWGICTADPCFRNPPLYSHTLSGSAPDIREMNKLIQIEYLTFDSKQKFKRNKNQLIMHNSFQILVQILYQTELIGCTELSLVDFCTDEGSGYLPVNTLSVTPAVRARTPSKSCATEIFSVARGR